MPKITITTNDGELVLQVEASDLDLTTRFDRTNLLTNISRALTIAKKREEETKRTGQSTMQRVQTKLLCNQALYESGKLTARCIRPRFTEHDHDLDVEAAVKAGFARHEE